MHDLGRQLVKVAQEKLSDPATAVDAS